MENVRISPGQMPSKIIRHRKGASGRIAYVGDSRVRVSDIARLYKSIELELMAERIRDAVPSLSEEEILAAIRYWWSHSDEIDNELERDEQALSSLQSPE